MTSFAEALEAQVLTWQKIPNIESESIIYLSIGFAAGWTAAEANNPLSHSHEDKAVYGGLEDE